MEAAIVSHAEGSVGTVLGKLTALLAQEFKKLSGVRDEIKELKDELESMNAFLENLAKTEDHDKQVKTWMKQVREMAYDVEDCIDEFMHHVGGPIEGGLFLRYLRRGVRLLRTLKARHEIASNVKSLKTRVHSVSERRSRYAHHVSTPPESSGSIGLSIDHRIPDLSPKEGKIVGIEDRIDKIIWWLVDDELDQRVISIVGYGGLGKTTLAMAAYENPTIKNSFDCRAKILVSQKFNRNVLLRDILKQVCPPPQGQTSPLETIESLNGSELISKLQNHLNNKRYVIVIDDIWTEPAWNSIKSAFPNNNNGSRIIVTTRIKSVAKSCSFPYLDCIYQMERLGETESKNLFFTKIFGHSKDCPSELTLVSNSILKKCGGMPLAILSIAGLLYVKPNKTRQEWLQFYKSLGSELESNSSLEGMRKILNRSYNDLPYHLKTCFLYMSIFPEDQTIQREKLVRRWVAEGFVGGKRGLSQEQVGESYFDEFINRNLIQAVHFSIDGRVQTCRVHDMILELMIAKSMEDNFVSIVRDQYSLAPRDKIRRLSVHCLEKKFINHGLYHTRSLSVFQHANTICKWISLSSFKVVRVLDLENCGIMDYHLKDVGNLFLLKYLGLRGNSQLKKLPTQICKLQSLEMVDIKDTNITKLPKRISNLPNLKHLVASNGMDGPGCEISRLNLEKMSNLETLTSVSFGKKTSKSLET